MHLFYTPDITVHATKYTLNEEESKHCVKVLRLGEGAQITLFDGRGNLFQGKIVTAHLKHTEVCISNVLAEFGKRNHHLHLAVAPTKNIDRFEWLLEKATEIGVDEITPILCERSERKEVKLERLNKVITAATKQSLTAYHPTLNKMTKFADFLKQSCDNNHNQKFIAHCLDKKKDFLSRLIVPKGKYCILIGPEGDFSPSEIDAALRADYHAVSLGNTRLRTETAALYACMEINFLNRD